MYVTVHGAWNPVRKASLYSSHQYFSCDMASSSGISFRAMMSMDTKHSPDRDSMDDGETMENGIIRKTLSFDSSDSSSDEPMDVDMGESPASKNASAPCKKKRFVQSKLNFSNMSSPSLSPLSRPLGLANISTNTPIGSVREERKRVASKVSPTWTGPKEGNGRQRVTDNVVVRKRKVAESNTKILPTVRGRHADLKYISCETLSQLINSKPSLNAIGSVSVIDCRYPYEFQAGHIRGAINIHTKEQMLALLFPSGDAAEAKRSVIIFHCEFSSKRGPDLARVLREEDRKRNRHRYPMVSYPEVYLLEGGYKAFFESFQAMCDPPYYKPMDADGHEQELSTYRKTWKTKPVLHKKMRPTPDSRL